MGIHGSIDPFVLVRRSGLAKEEGFTAEEEVISPPLNLFFSGLENTPGLYNYRKSMSSIPQAKAEG